MRLTLYIILHEATRSDPTFYCTIIQETIVSCIIHIEIFFSPLLTVPSALSRLVQQMQPASTLYIAIPAFCETGSHAAYCRQAYNADARRWVRSSRDHDGRDLARFESDKAGYVKAPLIVSRLLSGSTHREDADLVIHCLPEDHASRMGFLAVLRSMNPGS